MNREDQETADLIATLRGTEPSGRSAVSVDRAVKAGRRKVYTRRSVAIITAAAAIVAVALAPSVIGSQLSSEPPAAGTTGPTEFRIAYQEFNVGSAGGYKPFAYETGDMQQVIWLRAADRKLGKASGLVHLWPVGRPRESGGSAEPLPPPHDTDKLPGGKFYILSSEPERTLIAWQWTPGAWGFVELDELPPTMAEGDGVSRAIHVAESIAYGHDRRVTYPFTIPDNELIFDGITSVRFSMEPSSNGRRAISVKMADPRPVEAAEPWITVGIQPSGGSVDTNTTINGKRARQTADGVVIPDFGHGYDVVSHISNPNFGSIDAFDAAYRLAGAVRLVSTPLDERTWTADPTR